MNEGPITFPRKVATLIIVLAAGIAAYWWIVP